MKSIQLTLKQAALLACSVTDRSLLPKEFESALIEQVQALPKINISNELKRELPMLKKGNFYSPAAVRLVHAHTLPRRAPYLLESRKPRGLPPMVVSHYKKGGTGKTTILANVAIALATQGIRVLYFDADPQGTSTTLFGIDIEDPNLRTLQNVLFGHPSTGGRPVAPKDAIMHLYDNAVLDLIPSDIALSAFDRIAYTQTNRERLFVRLLKEHSAFFSTYDIILVDTNPGTNLLNFSLMFPASHILMSVSLDVPSMKSMRLMHSEAAEMADAGGSPKSMIIVGNAYQSAWTHSKESLKALRAHYGEQMMHTVIPNYVGVSRQGWLHANGRTLIEKEPSAPTTKRLWMLANEIAEHVLWEPLNEKVLSFVISESRGPNEVMNEPAAAKNFTAA